jgi:hypothetical protein
VQHFLAIDGLLCPNSEMARPPNAKNLKQPIRVLRSLCSERGEASPMSQLGFSQMVDVPASTIKAIENQERALSQEVLSKINSATGALWEKEGESWVWVAGGQKVPYTYEIFCKVRAEATKRPPDSNDYEKAFLDRAAHLFKQVPDSKWWPTLLKLEKCLHDCGVDAGVFIPNFGPGSSISGWGDKRRGVELTDPPSRKKRS